MVTTYIVTDVISPLRSLHIPLPIQNIIIFRYYFFRCEYDTMSNLHQLVLSRFVSENSHYSKWESFNKQSQKKILIKRMSREFLHGSDILSLKEFNKLLFLSHHPGFYLAKEIVWSPSTGMTIYCLRRTCNDHKTRNVLFIIFLYRIFAFCVSRVPTIFAQFIDRTCETIVTAVDQSVFVANFTFAGSAASQRAVLW